MDEYRREQQHRWAQRQDEQRDQGSTSGSQQVAPSTNSYQQSPLPNPWATSPAPNPQYSTLPTASASSASAGTTVQVADLGYTRIDVTAEEMQARPCRTTAMLLWCPCLLGSPCGPRHLQDMKAAARTFIVGVTILDVFMYVVEMALGSQTKQGLSMLAPPTCVLAELGAGFTPAILGPKHEVWRLVTPMVLHGGPIHIAANMYVQLLSGLRIEYEWGTAKTALAYIVSGIGGGLLSAVASPDTVSVGASGAIVGLIGCWAGQLVCEWGERDPRARGQQAWQVATFLILLAAIGAPSAAASASGDPSSGALPGTDIHIDNYAHGGGLLVGVLLGFVLWSQNPSSCCCADRLPQAFLNPAPPQPMNSQQNGDEEEGWDCGCGVLTRAFQRSGTWVKGLGTIQRSALGALLFYFGVLFGVLFSMNAPHREICC
mmetsp:Transcript_7059/g.13108  ORF Transcript_7059/g.13108 Transcript_7059/m.13108 type:complete len:431 (-) Transcript_7059:58-1350(-)